MIEIIRDEDRFYSMRDDWNRLLEKSGADNPYLTHEWLSSWWKAYKDAKGLNIVVFKERGQIIGVMPLVLLRETICGVSIKVLKFFSDHWGAMDLILTEGRAECIEEFFSWFLHAKIADAVILSRIPEDSKNAGIIERVVKGKKLNYEKKELKNTVILLEGNWADYLKGLTKKLRYEIKNKQKRLLGSGNVRYERITEIEDADTVLPSLMAVGAKSWKFKDGKGIAVSSRGQQFYRNIISEWGKAKKLDVSILRRNDLPIAFAFRIRHKETCYALETAYDRDLYDYSPGLVVNAILLEKLFDDKGVSRYVLGEMNESKKRQSKDYDTEVKINIYNRTPKMRALFVIKKAIAPFFGRIERSKKDRDET